MSKEEVLRTIRERIFNGSFNANETMDMIDNTLSVKNSDFFTAEAEGQPLSALFGTDNVFVEIPTGRRYKVKSVWMGKGEIVIGCGGIL